MIKFKKFFKENKQISIILILAIILHVLSLFYLGPTYNIESDDIRYIESGITFKNTGSITLFGQEPTAQIMPGMTYLIGLISFIFGEGKMLYIALKILWMIMGILSIYGLYKIMIEILPKSKYKTKIAAFTTIPLLMPTFLWLDNIILTETPFMCSFIWLLYFTLKESNKHSKKNFIMILTLYMSATLLKANFALYPLIMLIYLWFKKYDRKLMLKEVLISALVMSLFFIPWIIRNYNIYHEFIPLTYGSGNPKLYGTYQGYGYPPEDDTEFQEYIRTLDDPKIKDYLDGKSDSKQNNYYSLKIDDIHANYRIKKWWKQDKISFIISYTILKPIRLFTPFMWGDLFKINRTHMLIVRVIEIIIFVVSFIIILIKKALNKDILFLLANFIIQVIIYSTTFTFSRYGQTLVFILFIISGYGINVLFNSTKSKHHVKKV